MVCFNCFDFVLYPATLNFFFFQAEDGIRDRDVTGVQTCALPISGNPEPAPFERATTHGAALVFAESVDRSPADVPAAQAIGVGLPQRIRGQLSVTTAAEALDNERLHGLIFVGRDRDRRPPTGGGA